MGYRAKIEAHPAFDSLHQEDDGCFERKHTPTGGSYQPLSWWCYVKAGWWIPSMGCGSIHEVSLKTVWKLIQTAELEPKCDGSCEGDCQLCRAEQLPEVDKLDPSLEGPHPDDVSRGTKVAP